MKAKTHTTQAVTLTNALSDSLSPLSRCSARQFLVTHQAECPWWSHGGSRPTKSGLKGERHVNARAHAAPAVSPMFCSPPVGGTAGDPQDRGHEWEVTDTGWRRCGSGVAAQRRGAGREHPYSPVRTIVCEVTESSAFTSCILMNR